MSLLKANKTVNNKRLIWLGSMLLFFNVLLIATNYHKKNLSAANEFDWLGEASPVGLNIREMLGQLPGGFETIQEGVKIQEGNGWQVYRLFPSGTLEVFYSKNSGEYDRLDLPEDWRRHTYPMLIIPAPDRLRIIAYDVVKNIASGRGIVASQRGFDLFEIDPNGAQPVRLVAGGIDLAGGIDSLVYARLTNSTISICADNKCADIDGQGTIRYWSLAAIRDYEFVEVAFDRDSAFGLVRKKWDDRLHGPISTTAAELFLARLSKDGAEIESITGVGVPFGLFVQNGKAGWRTARTREEFQDLFLFEISRMKNRGLIDYGDHNLEGRLAWSQVYYLNGLITAGSQTFDFVGEELKEKIRTRVRHETDLVARLSESDYPGYFSKRYSIEREPLLFALHLGRVSQLLARAQAERMSSTNSGPALVRLQSELWALGKTVEHLGECELGAANRASCTTLFYRKGYPFWADGVNVPYNYISGYALGLLSLPSAEGHLDRAQMLLKPLYQHEKLVALPRTWRYWWGTGYDGWSSDGSPSLNTPAWQGDGAGMGLAHITYRSIDAAALLLLHTQTSTALTADELVHFKHLVEKGWLLPQVSEYFSGLGEQISLSEEVVRRFSRSAQAWEIQSQIWALRDMQAQLSSAK